MNVTPTITAPNFVSIMTGAAPRHHGITTNESLRTSLDVDNILHHCDDHVLISDWRQMRHLLPPAVPKELNFRYRRTWTHLIDEIKQRRRHRQTKYPAAAPAALLVMNTSTLDTAAHKHGIDSPEAQSVINYIDERTEKVQEWLVKSKRQYVLVGVADHGFGRGADGDHEDADDPDVRQVPLLFVTNTDIARPKFRTTLKIAPWIVKLLESKEA